MATPTFKLSKFQTIRQAYTPTLPSALTNPNATFTFQTLDVQPSIKEKYPYVSNIQYVELKPTTEPETTERSPLRIGVVLSGGQAPGGHNVIMGVFDYIKRHHANSQLFGFLGGPRGVYTNSYVEITENFMECYRNQGGFDMICSGRDKIETEEQYANSLKYCQALNLHGLIIIGGDDSNTNAALLADYFIAKGSNICVIGCPKTIDGDLKNEFIEISFGFDTAAKTYSEVIGNICIDTLSSKKYHHFVRLMGRSASHIALECALQTRPNLTLIGEEVQERKMTLAQIVDQVADVILRRGAKGKPYGVFLIPEGLIEFIPEVNILIKELNEILSRRGSYSEEDIENTVKEQLTENSRHVFDFLPEAIRKQLLLDRDPHGNVQVAKIETERLLMLLLASELPKRGYQHAFYPQSHYFGYEGRSALPSNFDATYCYALGQTASALIRYNFTGCMAVCRGLRRKPEHWQPAGCPLAAMMNTERRKGKDVAVIKKALVETDSPIFKAFERWREHWMINDSFRSPGPIQFDGVGEDALSYLLKPPTDEELYSPVDDERVKFPYNPRRIENMSPMERVRAEAPVELPNVFASGLNGCVVNLGDVIEPDTEEAISAIAEHYPALSNSKFKRFIECTEGHNTDTTPVNIGVAFNGRQAAGGHNVIEGLLHALKSRPGSCLIGFLGGNLGIFDKKYFEITSDNFKLFRNQGGYDFLGRGTDELRKPEHLAKVKETCISLNLDGLVIVGATHSMTDTGILANYLLEHGVKTRVVGIPATIDNNIAHHLFEMSVGFDTASHIDSQLIGNMMTDAASATKYWYFIRLMGRDPSHLVQECALQTHPNIVIISEVHKREGDTLDDVVRNIADQVQFRAEHKKLFGTLLVPEGLLQQLSHFRELITEIANLLKNKSTEERHALTNELLETPDAIDRYFAHYSGPVLKRLPKWFREQMLTRYDSEGNIQLSLLETERLLAEMVAQELKARRSQGIKVPFSPVCHFFGYQGRSSMPTLFDCSLAATYGSTAAVVICAGLTGYMTTARGLVGPVSKWKVGAIPLTGVMKVKGRSQYGRNIPMVTSAEVDLTAKAFQTLSVESKSWLMGDHFTNPGPIQFFSKETSRIVNLTLQYNHQHYLGLLEQISDLCHKIQNICRFGVREDLLRTAVIGLSSVEGILGLHKKI